MMARPKRTIGIISCCRSAAAFAMPVSRRTRVRRCRHRAGRPDKPRSRRPEGQVDAVVHLPSALAGGHGDDSGNARDLGLLRHRRNRTLRRAMRRDRCTPCEWRCGAGAVLPAGAGVALRGQRDHGGAGMARTAASVSARTVSGARACAASTSIENTLPSFTVTADSTLAWVKATPLGDPPCRAHREPVAA